MSAADEDIRRAGFNGYVGCPHLAVDARCPTPFACSERLACPIDHMDSACHQELLHIRGLLDEAVHLIDSACGDEAFLSRNAELVADFIRRAS